MHALVIERVTGGPLRAFSPYLQHHVVIYVVVAGADVEGCLQLVGDSPVLVPLRLERLAVLGVALDLVADAHDDVGAKAVHLADDFAVYAGDVAAGPVAEDDEIKVLAAGVGRGRDD